MTYRTQREAAAAERRTRIERRNRAVRALRADGMTMREIADVLGLSLGAVARIDRDPLHGLHNVTTPREDQR